MLATGASLAQVLTALFASHGTPATVHVLAAIASQQGLITYRATIRKPTCGWSSGRQVER